MNMTAVKTMIEEASPVSENWPDPDLALFQNKGIAPPNFDDASLPSIWASWCKLMAGAKACPVDFVALNLLVSASEWLGNSRRVAASGDWIEPPHLWGAIVAPPSGGKTPSQQAFTEASKQLEIDAEPEWAEQCAEHEKNAAFAAAKRAIWEKNIAKAAKDGLSAPELPLDAKEPEVPSRPRVLLQDATTQETVNLLSVNPKGLLLTRDELAGWFGSFDRYSGAGADRGFYLESYNGGRYSVDLVKHAGKPISVPYASLAITGGLQPDKLREALAGSDDGLTSRFCYVWPTLVPYTPLTQNNFTQSKTQFEFLISAARRLRGLRMDMSKKGNPVALILPLSNEALTLFENIRKEATEKARSMKGLAAGWHGKTPGRALRLALTIGIMDKVCG